MPPTGFGLASGPPSTPDDGAGTSTATTIEPSTPWIAAGDGDLPLLRASLEALDLPPTASDDNGFTLCHAAAAYNRVEVLRWLLRREGDEAGEGGSGGEVVCGTMANVGDTDGDTPLHHCDHVEAARALVEEGGADPAATNNEGRTPLQLKLEELKESEGDAEDDSDDDEDREALRGLVNYLKGLEAGIQPRSIDADANLR